MYFIVCILVILVIISIIDEIKMIENRILAQRSCIYPLYKRNRNAIKMQLQRVLPINRIRTPFGVRIHSLYEFSLFISRLSICSYL